MANSDKNILITPNRGQADLPKIEFTGADNNTVTLSTLDNGTLSFSGSSGQLFSVSDSMTGTIFSVNDVSGIPSIEVDDDGTVRLAEYSGNVLIGTNTDAGNKLQIQGDMSVSGTYFTSGDIKLDNDAWYWTRYSPSHDWVRINANTGGGLDIYNQTDSGFAQIRVGSVSIAGTQIIDASRRLLSVGHISQTDTIRPNVRWGSTSSSTGQIRIQLPGTSSNYDMVNIHIDVYEYNSKAGSQIVISGHNWTTGWFNTRVSVIGGYDKPIYLARTGSDYFILLGDVDSTWAYGTVNVTKVTTASFYTVQDWDSGWAIGQYTSELTALQKTNNLNSTSSNTLETYGRVRAVGGKMMLSPDATYGGYNTLAFNGNLGNGGNRIFAHGTGADGMYICSATSKHINFRVNGSSNTAFSMRSNGDFRVGTTELIKADRSIVNLPSINGNAVEDIFKKYPYASNNLARPVGTAESWYKIASFSDGTRTVSVKILTNGDNTTAMDHFEIATSAYGMQTHIMRLPSTKYNASKLLEVRTNYASGATHEIWVRVGAITTSTGGLQVWMTDPGVISDFVAGTAPAVSTADSTLAFDHNSRDAYTLETSRGVKIHDGLVVSKNIYTSGTDNTMFGGGSGRLRVGRDSTQNLDLYVDDANCKITADQDNDSNGTHNFILNRTFDGTGGNNFLIQKNGSNQLAIDTNGYATFAGILRTNQSLVVDQGATLKGRASAWTESGNQGKTKGSLHFNPNSATDHHGSSITFGAHDTGSGDNAQAGIYTRTDGSYGTKMMFSTTDSYANGSKTALTINSTGAVTLQRSGLVVRKPQQSSNFSNTAALKLHPSFTTNTSGRSSVFLGTSTNDKYGITLNGHRAGTDGTPTFELRTHNNSHGGVSRVVISNDGSTTFKGPTIGNTSGDTVRHFTISGARHHLDLKEIRTAGSTDWQNTTYRLQMRVDSTNHQAIDFVSDGSYNEHIDFHTGNLVHHSRFNSNGDLDLKRGAYQMNGTTVLSSGRELQNVSIAPYIRIKDSTHIGPGLNVSELGPAVHAKASVLQDSQQGNVLAFKHPTIYSREGTTWTNRGINKNLTDGKMAHAWSVLNIPRSWEEVIIYFGNNLGYSFLNSIAMLHSTNGNSMRIIVETHETAGATDTGWNIAYDTVSNVGSWPGSTFIRKNIGVGSGYDNLFRIRIIPSWSPNYTGSITIGQITATAGYGGFARLFDWDGDKNVTFYNTVNASEVSSPHRLGRVMIRDNSLEEHDTNLDTAAIAVNYRGYAAGTTKFRNFDIFDGKGSLVTRFTGNGKVLDHRGTVLGNHLESVQGGSIGIQNVCQKWMRSYVVGGGVYARLLMQNGTNWETGGVYKVTAHISGTGTDQFTQAVFACQNGTWKVNVTSMQSTSSNFPQFLVHDGNPHLYIAHTSNYTVHVLHERIELLEGTGTDNFLGAFGAGAYLSNFAGNLRFNPWGGSTYDSGHLLLDSNYNVRGTAFKVGSNTVISASRHGSLAGVTSTGTISVENSAPILVLKDTNSTGDAQMGYISLKDSDNVEKGWLGYGSASNSDLTVRNSLGRVRAFGTYFYADGYTVSPRFMGNAQSSTAPAVDDCKFDGFGVQGNRTTNPVYIHNQGNGGVRISSNANLGTGNGLLVKDNATTCNGTFTASGNITAYSDINLKDNITEIDNALEKVNAIRGVTYDRIDQENARHAGVIAQEVEEVLPEVVHTDDEGIKSVAYGNMVGLLIEAIKELKTEVEDLKSQLEKK